MEKQIVPLPRFVYKGYEVSFDYDTDHYYDMRMEETSEGFAAHLTLTPFPATVHKRFVDALYEDHWGAAECYGIFDGSVLAAALEIAPETWNKRLRVTNIWVEWNHRRHGLGRLLMDRAKDIARARQFREVVLETQTCNTPAIAFYLSQGFSLVGFDLSCYTNDDVAKKEVRLEMVYRTT